MLRTYLDVPKGDLLTVFIKWYTMLDITWNSGLVKWIWNTRLSNIVCHWSSIVLWLSYNNSLLYRHISLLAQGESKDHIAQCAGTHG